MKYAIISDVHGNLPALEATLSDAGAQGADMYLMLGDYTNTFPWGNEVMEIIRGLKSAVVIRGNGEDYLINLQKKNQNEWNHEQFKPIYWSYRSLTPENLGYLTALPETSVISANGDEIHLAHSLKIFYRSPGIELFHSSHFRTIMSATPFSHEEYLALARAALLSHSDALADIHALPKGVYLFGHNHLQFHMEHDGRLFVNPGSCGAALDWDTTAAYTLLEHMGECWTVVERRVNYNLNAASEGLRSSGFASYAPVWSDVWERELLSGKDYSSSFVLHLIETGRKLGQTEFPVSNNVWNAAIRTWDADKI